MDILWLDDPRCADAQLVGGKAAQLSLLAADFDVPDGFCVPAPALASFDSDTDAVPEPLRAAIAAAYEALATRAGLLDPPVAVRSSALDEDGAKASFAGQHETLLNVSGADAVVAAVARCARSARSDRATAYRAHHALEDATGVAVLVQLLVPADASAVAFSLDPVSGDRSQICVEATVGLGEALVGGQVSPDRYLLRKHDLDIASRYVTDKQRMIVPIEGGVASVDIPLERRGAPALDDAQVAAVAKLARTLEERLGWPVDVECAIVGQRVALLQCRPITARGAASPPPAVEGASPDDAALTWRWGRQAFPGPVTPLLQSYLPFHTQGWRRDSRANGTAGEIRIRFEGGYYYTIWQPTGLTTWDEVDRNARAAERGAPARWEREFLPRLRADHEQVRALDRAALSEGELALVLQEALTAQVTHFTIHAHMASIPYSAVERLLNWYAERFPDEGEADAYRLLGGFDNTSVASAHALWELSQGCDEGVAAALRARDWAALPEAFAERWTSYLATFGHRTRALADPASPTWQEDPEPLAQLVLGYAAQSVPDPAIARARLAAEREEAMAAVRARLAPAQRDEFEELLATAQANYPLTEDHNFWLDQQSPADLRLLCGELGRRMAARGVLEGADDIAFLTLQELVLWGFGLADPLRARVAERRAAYERQRRITPPGYLGAPPEPASWLDRFGGPATPLQAEPGEIAGVGASAGQAVGRVRVAHTLDEAQLLEAGEVLVCPSTDPSWTPLFALAAALVTDTGGSLCHAAVVAREYRLPAVVGTHLASAQLHTGQRVKVDGLAGRVRLLEGGAER